MPSCNDGTWENLTITVCDGITGANANVLLIMHFIVSTKYIKYQRMIKIQQLHCSWYFYNQITTEMFFYFWLVLIVICFLNSHSRTLASRWSLDTCHAQSHTLPFNHLRHCQRLDIFPWRRSLAGPLRQTVKQTGMVIKYVLQSSDGTPGAISHDKYII